MAINRVTGRNLINLKEDSPSERRKLSVIRDNYGEITKAKTPPIDKDAMNPKIEVALGREKKKKDPIVSKKQLEESGFDTLRDFMNHYKYDEDKGRFVKREKALKRRDNMPIGTTIGKPSMYLEDYKKGGSVKPKRTSASKRADGIAKRGRTRI
jgi:hypothetical protein